METSNTPRTDAALTEGWSGDAALPSADFARTLERELAAKQAALAIALHREQEARVRNNALQVELAETIRSKNVAVNKWVGRLNNVEAEIPALRQQLTQVSNDYRLADLEAKHLRRMLDKTERELTQAQKERDEARRAYGNWSSVNLDNEAFKQAIDERDQLRSDLIATQALVEKMREALWKARTRIHNPALEQDAASVIEVIDNALTATPLTALEAHDAEKDREIARLNKPLEGACHICGGKPRSGFCSAVHAEDSLRSQLLEWQAACEMLGAGVKEVEELLKIEWEARGFIGTPMRHAVIVVERLVALSTQPAEALALHVAPLVKALERLRDCDWVISLPDRMDAVRDIAREALAAWKGKA